MDWLLCNTVRRSPRCGPDIQLMHIVRTALRDADTLIKDMLSAADIDHDGKISYDEFRKFCNQTEQELWQLFQSIDRDHSGRLKKENLSTAFARAGVTVSDARLERFFDYIDKDHDGSIDFSEWRGEIDFTGMVQVAGC